MQNNVMDYLNEIVKVKPDKIAFANEDEQLTFLEVYNQSRAVASFLHRKEVYHKPVVVFMRKHPKEITAFFGVITAGDFCRWSSPAGSQSDDRPQWCRHARGQRARTPHQGSQEADSSAPPWGCALRRGGRCKDCCRYS